MLDVLIQNASIVDGTGVPAYQGSVGIREGYPRCGQSTR